MNQENNDQLSNQEKILAAARTLMVEKGVNKTSLADIAHAAGISKGTLFYYYASKDDLVADITIKHFDNMGEIFKEHLPRHIENMAPAEILQMRLEQAISDHDVTRLDLYLFQEGTLGNEAIKEKFAQRKRIWKKNNAEDASIVYNISDPKHLSALGTILLAISDGLAIHELIEPGSVNIEEVSSILSEMITLLRSTED